jgi:BTB/POZ domain
MEHPHSLSLSFIMSAFPESENDQNAMPAAPFIDTWVDCIVRSSDGVDFRIFKIILSLASPIFADTFNNPGLQSISEQDYNGPQVVTVSENSKVLDLCLRHLQFIHYHPLPY